jgi:hypothetical protein
MEEPTEVVFAIDDEVLGLAVFIAASIWLHWG